MLTAALDYAQERTSRRRRRAASTRGSSIGVRAVPGRDRCGGRRSPRRSAAISGTTASSIDGQQKEARSISTASARATSRRWGSPLVAGRDFDDRDTPQSPKVAIVTQSFVRKYFGGARRHRPVLPDDGAPASRGPSTRSSASSRDTKYTDLREAFAPLAYLASNQDDEPDPSLQLVRPAATASLPSVTAASRACSRR